MQTIKFYIKISAITLGIFFAGTSFAASPYYVNNPSLCPTDAFSQSCVGGLEVCGVNPSNVVSCYDTNTFSPPAAQGSTSSNTATTTGGYYIDCYGYDTAAPYCNNNGSFYCMQNSSCNSLQKVTLCTANVWAASTCGTCKAGYNDCDGNSVNGCSGATEHDGVACVTSLSLPGTWQNCVCVGSVLKLGSDSVSGATSVIQGGAASVFFINGLNVGIGSSAPNDTFSIANAGVAPAGSSNTGHNYTSTYLSSDDYALANYGVVKTLIASATSTLAALWGGTLNGNIWNGAAGAGNVGIGTTAPGSRLSIVDTGIANTPTTLLQGFNNIPYATGNGVGAARLELGHGILHGYIESGSVSETDSSSGYLAFGTRQPVNSVLEAMRINTAGNVGIGTTGPTAKLHILDTTSNGDNSILRIAANNALGSANLGFATNGGIGLFQLDYAGNMVFRTPQSGMYFDAQGSAAMHFRTTNSNTERLTILNNGNVGIGTLTPNDIFSISNSGAASAPAGSDRTGHNFTSTYLSSDNYALANYGIVKSLISDATSSLPTITNYWSGTKNGTIWNGDAGAGNVGIGTTTPIDKFQVYGNSFLGKISGYPFKSLWSWESDHSGYYSGIGYQDLSANNKKLYTWWVDNVVETNINSILNIATPGHTFDGTAPNNGRVIGARIMSSGSSYFNGGNVGIGTTNPGAKLDLNIGTSISNGYRLLFNASTAGSAWRIKNPNVDNGTEFGTVNYNDLSLITNDTEKLRITVAGNVGIGTTVPGSPLEVNGTIRGGASSVQGSLILAGNYSANQYVNTFGGHYSSAGTVIGFAVRPKPLASGYVSSADNIAWYRAAINLDGGLHLFTGGSQSVAIGSDVAMTERLTVLNSGNVGINTVVPNDIFSIGNSGSAPAGSSNTGHNYTNTYLSSDDYALANYGLVKTLISAATSSSALWGGTMGGNIWSLNSANVGIGTTNPLSALDIYGANPRLTLAHNVINAGTVGIDFLLNADTSTEKKTAIVVTPYGSYSRGNMSFVLDSAADSGNYDYVTDTKLFLKNDGSVGIGTTTPASAINLAYKTLQIQSGFPSFGGAINLSTNDGDSVEISNFNTNLYIQNNGDTHFQDLSGNKRMSILSAGYVGIGTTSPFTKLDVIANVGAPYVGMRVGYPGTNSGLFSGRVSVFSGGLYSYIGDSYYYNSNSWRAPQVVGSAIRFKDSGGIGFFADSGLTVDTNYIPSERMTILSSGNIGINTVVPNDIFSIGNSGSAPAGSSNTGHNYTNTYLSSDDYALANYGLVKTLISAATSSSALWGGTMGGSIWNLNSSNVGIGTTVPQGQFDIRGGQSTVGTLLLSRSHPTVLGTNFGLGLIRFGGEDVDSSISNWNAASIVGEVDSTWSSSSDTPTRLTFYTTPDASSTPIERLRINNSGYVGIGTTNPGATLDVNGIINALTSYRVGNSTIADVSAASARFAPSASFTSVVIGSASTLSSYFPSGNVGVGITNPIYKLDVSSASGSSAARITSAQAWTDLYLYNSGGYGIIETAGNRINLWSGNTNTMTLFGGNVGIGTTAPNDIFSIGNAGAAPAGSSNTGHNYTSTYLSSDDYALANYGIVKTLIAAATSTMPTGANFWGGTLNGNIWNGDAGVGNVGVGTTNPTQKLTVSGNALIDGGNMLYLRDTSTYINEGSGLNIVAGNTRSINLAGGTGTDMTITSAGNVGIGTSTALSKLDVQSNTGKQANFFGYSEVSSVAKAYNYNGSIVLGNVAAYQGIIDYYGAGTPGTLTLKNTYASYTTNSRINFDIGANNIMSVQGSGNVGIGTTTPSAKLHVYTNGTNIFRNEAGGTAGYNYFDMAREYNYRTNAIRFITNGTQNWSLGTLYNGGSANSLFSISSDDNLSNSKFIINTSGNVGIGTTAPNDIFSIGNAGSAPAGSSNTGHNFTSTYLNNDDYALTNYGLVKSMISATGGLAVYATSTPATYAGNVGGYTAANALCSAVISGSHICTSEEMLNTVNKGQAGNIPLNSMLWINNGPPAFTANANDCIGWTSNASNSYSAQWNRPTGYTDGFGSLNNCNIPRKFACCQ